MTVNIVSNISAILRKILKDGRWKYVEELELSRKKGLKFDNRYT